MMIITPQKLKKVVKKIIQKKNSYSKKNSSFLLIFHQ